VGSWGYSESTREVVADGQGERGARAEWFHGFVEIHPLKCVSVNCHLWACEVTKFWLLDCSDAWFVWQGL
jgi:hypothetical protein